jgi:hypothetical protein
VIPGLVRLQAKKALRSRRVGTAAGGAKPKSGDQDYLAVSVAGLESPMCARRFE